eukprot:scaffold9027_cov61-Attheya_sp.AAC.7
MTLLRSPSTGRPRKRTSAAAIVAPGGGTSGDVRNLSRSLGLPQEAVQAIMASRGRGLTRRSAASAAPTAHHGQCLECLHDGRARSSFRKHLCSYCYCYCYSEYCDCDCDCDCDCFHGRG